MDTNELLRPTGQKLAVIGCGGKTSLIELLAQANRDKKVLIMTTTKIKAPRQEGVTLCETLADCLVHTPHQGIQCLGVFDAVRGKFSGPPPEYWERLAQGYDLVLMEADGSRSLPCKGWADFEPVVPAFATATVGVVTLLGRGRPANGETVLRVPEFCRLTGLAEGDAITKEALADMVGAPGGMFKNAVGRRVLFINQVEGEVALAKAKELAALLRQRHPGAAGEIYAGSVIENHWCIV